MVNYVYRFVDAEPALCLWDEADLIMMDKLLVCYGIQFASILLKIFASMFIMDIGLKFSFLIVIFGIRMMLVS